MTRMRRWASPPRGATGTLTRGRKPGAGFGPAAPYHVRGTCPGRWAPPAIGCRRGGTGRARRASGLRKPWGPLGPPGGRSLKFAAINVQGKAGTTRIHKEGGPPEMSLP